MAQFTYHQKAYLTFLKKGKISFFLGLIVFSVVFIFGERIEMFAPYLMGFGIGIFFCALVYKMICDQAAKRVQMSSLEVFPDSVFITFPVGGLLAKKESLRLSYSEIEKLEWDPSFRRSKKKNLEIHHKNGTAAILIDEAIEAVVLIHEAQNQYQLSSVRKENAGESEKAPEEAESVKVCCPSCGAEIEIDLKKTSVLCSCCAREWKQD